MLNEGGLPVKAPLVGFWRGEAVGAFYPFAKLVIEANAQALHGEVGIEPLRGRGEGDGLSAEGGK